jgi:TolB-like protein
MRFILYVALIFTLLGCANLNDSLTNVDSEKPSEQLLSKPKKFHDYAEDLVRQLLDTMSNDRIKSLIVGPIVPVESLALSANTISKDFGYQLQESVGTLLVQAGIYVKEHRVMASYEMGDEQVAILSRNAEKLYKSIDANHVVTGTYSQVSNEFIINLKIIDLNSQKVLGASTQYFPISALRGSRAVVFTDNSMQRTSY